jgi:hypothetical protein
MVEENLKQWLRFDGGTSVISMFVGAMVLAQSRHLHGRNWRRSRYYAEASAFGLLGGGFFVFLCESNSCVALVVHVAF